MKIDDIYNKMSLINHTKETAAGKGPEPAEGTPPRAESEQGPESRTRVDLSGTSVELNRVSEALDKGEAESPQKIQEIKEMLESGSYEVEEHKVADRILKEALLDFLGS